ncbi:uncharacterized protein [Haliotis cracherodii]|uniref:uncharacterized protein n=1 Tax=Haliotis cracherodii TaxID=6455 RepID=UPI0039EA0E9B
MSNPFMYDKVVSVISKPPEKRQDFEVHTLVSWFRKKSQMCSQLKTDIVMDIVRNCQFVTKVRDDVIIKQGDKGECFYIILGGQISIYILNKDKDGEDESELDIIYRKGKDGKLDRSKLGYFVTHLGAGSPFGEVALASDDCIRTASVISDERTDLVVVDRQLYNRSVRDVLAKEFRDKERFIAGNKLFSSWPPKYRKQLAMAMYMETYSYEAPLVRQGENTENMYFILSGQVEVQIDPSQHPLQYRKIFLAASQTETAKLLKKAEKARPPTEHHNSNNIKKRDNFKSMKLCYLGINESVGDIEMLLDLKTYMHTAVCKERTEVLVLEMKHYERLFVRRHQRTIESMRDELAVKLETRISLLTQKEDIPLLGYLHSRIISRYKPPPPVEKDRREMTTVSAAEKEFLNHRGPLIDMFGPGSVFYMIRVREKTKEKLRLKRHRKVDQIPPSHVHAVQLPQSMLLAAQNARDEVDGHGRDGPRSFKSIQSSHQKDQESNDDYMGDMDYYVDDDAEPLSMGVTIDQESHDAALTNLEERIRLWLKRENPKSRSKVAQLRRLALQDMDIQPRPGNRVVIRRRQPTSTPPLLDQEPTRETEREKLSHLKILLTNS